MSLVEFSSRISTRRTDRAVDVTETDAVYVEAPLMDTSVGLEVEKQMREFCACSSAPLREFASMFCLVHGGSFDLRNGWNMSDEIA